MPNISSDFTKLAQTLLVELLTEELPPKALCRLGARFAECIGDALRSGGFAPLDADVKVFVTPRRLAVQVFSVVRQQPDQAVERRGPALAACYRDGVPTPALLGFARSVGLASDALDQLVILSDGKQPVVAHRSVRPGVTLDAVLAGIVSDAMQRLPAPKLMRWGSGDGLFVRPVHGLMLLWGAEVISGSVLGLASGRFTLGHRFLSSGPLRVPHADAYEQVLHDQGCVVAGFEVRRERIRAGLSAACVELGARLASDDALLDEVAALVEWPVVLRGSFDSVFLEVPQACLILSMQQNQKYFPLLNSDGQLINQYLLVSNLQTVDPNPIIDGNGRVLRARLSDARFFFQQDGKHRLEDRVAGLDRVVYHNRLGSQGDRVRRLEQLAAYLGAELGVDPGLCARAARLAKADLLSDMVGEFPELQGIMGRIYATQNGEPDAVANAIAEHYQPRFAADSLPPVGVSTALALADKLELLVGIWGIGLLPTGDKDPFGLRRAALGVMRMLVEQRLSLRLDELLQQAVTCFPLDLLAVDTAIGVRGFLLDRLRHWLAVHTPVAHIESVLAVYPDQFDQLLARLQAVSAFMALPEASALIGANKRIRNLLRKADTEQHPVNMALLAPGAEMDLVAALQAAQPGLLASQAQSDHSATLLGLAQLKPWIDRYFTEVMILVDDAALRQNRVALLHELAQTLQSVADLSLLEAT